MGDIPIRAKKDIKNKTINCYNRRWSLENRRRKNDILENEKA